MPTDIRWSLTFASMENCWRTPPAHLPVDCDPSVSRSMRSTSTFRLDSWYASAHPMIPPPAMTTSALSMHSRDGSLATRFHQPPHLEDELQRGERCDLLLVEWRRHLDHIQADQVRLRGRGL